jgi:hypothetical protein
MDVNGHLGVNVYILGVGNGFILISASLFSRLILWSARYG